MREIFDPVENRTTIPRFSSRQPSHCTNHTVTREIISLCNCPIWFSGQQCTEYSHGLYQLHNETEIIQSVGATRVRLLGQLFRTDEPYPCRTRTFRDPVGARKEGRPPIRRMDTAEEGPKSVVFSNWKTKASKRMEWRSVVGAVRAGTRL